MRTRLTTTAVLSALALLMAAPAAADPPADDDFDHPVAFTAVPFETTQDTTEATEAADDPECIAGSTHTVWFSVTLPATTEIGIDTFGSDYDTVLSAWTGSRGSLEQVACNDDSGSLQSRIAFTAQAGVTYHVMAGAFPDSPAGTLVLHGYALPPRVTLAVTIDATGSVSGGAAVLHGTVTCSRPVNLTVNGTLHQQQGRRAAVGSYRSEVSCSGTTTWQATVRGETAAFRRGPADAVAVAEYVDLQRAETIRARAERTVQLNCRLSPRGP